MISVIICSVDPSRLARVSRNIGMTIGVPHEIIPVDNSSGRYGICMAYNIGGSQAKYPILCFMHEDISFETMDWGQRVCRHLEDPTVGLLGVAGGDARGLVPCSWSVPVGSKQINLIQHYKYSAGAPEHILETDPSGYADKKKVVALDGVWLCTRKDVFQKFKFDTATFTGFHGYDIDYSLQVSTGFQIYTVFDILIHHYSDGKPDRSWVKSAMLVSKKWRSRLPLSVTPQTKQIYSLHHWRSMRVFLERLSDLDYNYFQILYYLVYYSCNRFFSWRRLGSMAKFTLVNFLNKRRRQVTNPAISRQN
ncbi:MAG TPA: glycosyltransferase [Puia sp.]|nr:glycosyltransferase [Puia sp.]